MAKYDAAANRSGADMISSRENSLISCRQKSEIFSGNFLFDDYAIVFAGGGARGAWQIGVWKELIAQKVLKNPAKIVAGTSVGALNAALYAQSPGDATHAEKIWKEVVSNKKIKTVSKQDESSGEIFSGLKSIFVNDGLAKVIDEGLRKEFELEVVVCAYNKTKKQSTLKELKNLSTEEKKQWLLASTAIPVIFPSVKIGDEKYSDGGFGWDTPLRSGTKMVTQMNNAPVDEIIKKNGPKKIILLALSQIASTSLLDAPEEFTIYPIMPSKDLENPLDFGKDHIDRLIEQGQDDCKKWLEKQGTPHAIDTAKENAVIQNQLQKRIDIASKTYEKIRALSRDRSRAREQYEVFWYFLKNLEESIGRDEWSSAVERFLKKFLFYGLPQNIDDITEKQNNLIDCLKKYCQRDAQLKSLLESIKNHEEGSRAKIKDILLNYKQNATILKELPVERQRCTHMILNQLISQVELLSGTQEEDIKNKLWILGSKITELRDEIEKFFPEMYDPPLAGLKKECSSFLPNFLGREKELEELKESIDNNPGKTVLLHGYMGNGKRSIVRQYAKLYKDCYPGGILHITKASDEKTIAGAIRSVLQRYDENKLPAEEELALERIEKKLKEISGKKLVIVEDVKNAYEFFAEPDASRCSQELALWNLLHDPDHFSIIATSIESMAGEEEHVCLQHIGPMSEEDGMQMLSGEFPDPKAVYHKVLGNPWALDFIRKLYKKEKSVFEDCSEKEKNDILDNEFPEKVMDEFISRYVKPAFYDLSEKSREMLKYASLFPADICRKWLVDSTGDKRSLKELENKAWLERVEEKLDSGDKQIWYTMLDNTRDALRRIVDGTQLKQYGEKLCEFIVEKEWKDHIFSWKETETLAKLFLQWSEMPWKNDILPILFSLNLEDDLGDYLTEYKLYTLRAKVCRAAEKIVEALYDDVLKKKYRASLKIYDGHIKLDDGKIDDALNSYREALEIRENIEEFGPDAPETLLVKSYIATATGRKGTGRGEAEKLFEDCLAECRSRKDMLKQAEMKVTLLETMARLHKRYADFLSDNGDYRAAETNYRQSCCYALKAAVTSDDKRRNLWIGKFYFSLGNFYHDNDHPRKKIEKHLTKSREYLLKSSSRRYPHPDIKEIDRLLNK